MRYKVLLVMGLIFVLLGASYMTWKYALRAPNDSHVTNATPI